MVPSETDTSLLNGRVGAYEFGVMVALFMYGIVIVQAYSVLRCEAPLKKSEKDRLTELLACAEVFPKTRRS